MQAQQSHSAVRVLVTGATGFVGRTLISTAAGEIRWRPAVRSAPAAGLAADQIAMGSIDGQTDWSDALSGIDCIVHLAARVHVMNPTANDRTAFERTNVLGTEHLARAAAAAGVRRFIYLSSIKVNGESTRNRAFRADDVPQPQDDYARSKLEAERRCSGFRHGCLDCSAAAGLWTGGACQFSSPAVLGAQRPADSLGVDHPRTQHGQCLESLRSDMCARTA
jgi:nucleoside-diphosphate-sugar epimerase